MQCNFVLINCHLNLYHFHFFSEAVPRHNNVIRQGDRVRVIQGERFTLSDYFLPFYVDSNEQGVVTSTKYPDQYTVLLDNGNSVWILSSNLQKVP